MRQQRGPRLLPSVVSVALAALVVAGSARGATLHVAPDGTGEYPTIQDAVIAAVSGDSVSLADGTFTGLGNRDVDFLGKALVVASESGNRDAVVIDAEESGRGFLVSAQGPELRDLTIRNGFLTAPAAGLDLRGGAVHIAEGASLVVDNVVFDSNHATDHGGAIYLGRAATLDVTSSLFLHNSTPITASSGGAIRCDSLSVLTIQGCRFEGNYAEKGGAVYVRNNVASILDSEFVLNEADLGAAVYARAECSVAIERSDFFGNTALSRGGGFYAIDPGVVATIQDCRLSGNSALAAEVRNGGGAIFLILGPELTVTSSLISGNWAAWNGGAAYAEDATIHLVSTTIAGNGAAQRGGAFYGDTQISEGSVQLMDGDKVISWGNCAGTGGNEVVLETGATADLSCSVVDLAQVVGSVTTSDIVSSDPLFCDPIGCESAPTEAGDYALQFGSPASSDASPCGLLIGSEDLSNCVPLCPPRDFISDLSVPAEPDSSLWDDDVLHVVGDFVDGSLTHSVYGDAGAVSCGGTRVFIYDGSDRDVAALLGVADVFEDGSFFAVPIGSPAVDCVWIFAERDAVFSEGTRIAFDLEYPTVQPDPDSAFLYDPWNPYRIYGSGDYVNLRLLALDPFVDCDEPSGPVPARSSLLHVWADLSVLDQRAGVIPGFSTPADSILLTSLGADRVDNDGDWLPFLDLDESGFWNAGEPLRDDVGLDGIPNTNDFGEGDGVPTFGDPFVDENGNGVFDPGETFLDIVTTSGGSYGDHVFDPGEPNLDSRDLDEFGWYELRSSVAGTAGTVEQGFQLLDPDPLADGASLAVPIRLRDNGIDGGERPGALDIDLPFLDTMPDWNRSLSHVTLLDGTDPERQFRVQLDLTEPGPGVLEYLANETGEDSDGGLSLALGPGTVYGLGRYVDFTMRATPGDPVLYARMLLDVGDDGTWASLAMDPGPATGSDSDANGDGFPGGALFDEDADASASQSDGFDDDEDGVVDGPNEGIDFADREVHAAAQSYLDDLSSPFGNGLHSENDYTDNDNDAFFVYDAFYRSGPSPSDGYGRILWYNVDENDTNGFDDDNDGQIDEADEAPESNGYEGARDDDEDGIADGDAVAVPIDTEWSRLATDALATAPVPGPGVTGTAIRVDASRILGVRPPDGVDGETAPFYANLLAYTEVVPPGFEVLTNSSRTFSSSGYRFDAGLDSLRASRLEFSTTHGGKNLDFQRVAEVYGLATDGVERTGLRIDAYDPAGNERVGWMTPVRFTIDLLAPNVVIPGCDGVGNPSPDFADVDPVEPGVQIYDAGAHPADYELVAELPGPSDQDAVSVTFEGSYDADFATIDFSATDASAPFSALWPGTGMFHLENDPPDARRTVYFRARAVDELGNETPDDSLCVFQVDVVDGTAPSATLFQVGDDTDLSDGAEVYLDSTVVLAATLDDGDGTDASDIAQVNFERNQIGDVPDAGWIAIGSLVGESFGDTVSIDWNTTGLTAADYAVRAWAVDVEGNSDPGTAFQAQVTVAPIPQGACCVGEECSFGTEAQCASQEGAFFLGQPCDPSPCLLGACCSGAECAITSESECAESGGVFYAGGACDPNPCAEGACCVGTSCAISSRAECSQGEFREGDSCSPNPCMTGACCEDGGCTLRTLGECEDLGGDFVMAGSCDPDPCNSGACCLAEACSVTSQRECAQVEGVFRPGEVCDPNPCSLGACCEDEACSLSTRFDCQEVHGEFLEGANCDPSPCDFGACCAGDDCAVVSEAECVTQEGTFFADDFCDPSPCLEGACCVGDDCTFGAQSACVDLNGTFLPGAACDPNPCGQGACCVGESCSIVSQAGCDSLGGDYFVDEDCTPNPCTAGACCLDACTVVTRRECVAAGGVFLAGRNCDPDPCGSGACCVEEACTVGTESDCVDLGGVYLEGEACDPSPCDRGACCIGETCSVTSELECTDAGGEFRSDDRCDPSPCDIGVCCQDDQCSLVTEAACVNVGGQFLGDGECEPSPCVYGACCVGTECSLTTEAGCALNEGLFFPGAECDPSPCSSGACCIGDECSLLTELECVTGGGSYLGAVPCDPSPCLEGACCVAEDCVLGTEADCVALGGRFFPGDGCDPSPCLSGACCTESGCFVGTEPGCDDAGGSFFEGSPCTPSPCTTGACCVEKSCQVTSEAECVGLGGDFLLDLGCDPNPCDEGACCLDAECRFVNRASCDLLSGTFATDLPCDPSPCEVLPCCIGSECRLLTPAECGPLGGTVTPGTSCDPSPCVEGACCLGDDCAVVTAADCATGGGEFYADTSCDPSPCLTGACCVSSGCVVLSEADCDAAGGEFFVGSSCDPDPCLTGACCTADGCSQLSAGACAGLGGDHFAGQACDPSPCVEGACCVGDVCSVESEADCAADGGSFFASANCDPDPCLQGACCVGEECTVTSERDCSSTGGEFLAGDGCSPDPCVTGACCSGELCALGSEATCVQDGGEFFAGDDCDPNPCIEIGSCCLGDGSCLLISEADCTAAFGVEWNVDGVCDPNPCRPLIESVEIVGEPGDASWEVAASPNADVAEITGWFRRGGESTYRQVTGFQRDGATWVASFGEEPSLRGIEYYLDYQVQGESALRSYGSASTPRRIAFEETVPVPLPDAYHLRLLAAPGIASNANVYAFLESELGPPSATSWILATWNPSDAPSGPRESYVYATPETPTAWAGGRAYWFGIAEGDLDWAFRGVTRFPEAVSGTEETRVYEIPLSPGWNLIGNPAAYPVSLDPTTLLVRDGDAVQTWAARFGAESELIWVYDPARDAESPYQLANSVLSTWDGCWVENPTDRALVLGIPAAEASSAAIASGGAMTSGGAIGSGAAISSGGAIGSGAATSGSANGAETGSRPAPSPQLEVLLAVRSGGERRELAVGMVGPDEAPRLRRTVPPYPGQQLHASIVAPGGSASRAGRVEWRPDSGSEELWKVTIDAALPVQLTWALNGSETSAGDWSATIEDEGVGRTWSLHTLRSLDLPSGHHELVLTLARAPGSVPAVDELGLSLDPNPITDDTVISFRLPEESGASLSVFDVTGHRVWTMPRRNFPPGEHALVWDGESDGTRLPSGTYFIRLEVKSRGGVNAATRKFVLLR
ncbi:MAG: right-handed parallel beta-helix repeat-containing protein [Candidatus Eisenbacteria bacterium]|uniref:Right-handed parallel beta-helix repeat-containing protein n=1 Tax=Eiseniibacteriota bacterium TaxID=2212470 RepID=A0A956N979_UNCEI|nr:right-handed parallel beta-helix repeat-containing protein [Candidatus Eisenbacteria bacterium]